MCFSNCCRNSDPYVDRSCHMRGKNMPNGACIADQLGFQQPGVYCLRCRILRLRTKCQQKPHHSIHPPFQASRLPNPNLLSKIPILCPPPLYPSLTELPIRNQHYHPYILKPPTTRKAPPSLDLKFNIGKSSNSFPTPPLG